MLEDILLNPAVNEDRVWKTRAERRKLEREAAESKRPEAASEAGDAADIVSQQPTPLVIVDSVGNEETQRRQSRDADAGRKKKRTKMTLRLSCA